MKEFNYDVSTVRKNPFAERLRKEGHSIIIDYKPGNFNRRARIQKIKSTKNQNIEVKP